MDQVIIADDIQTDSGAHHFALPSALIGDGTLFLIQPDTPIHDVENCGDNAINGWARLKRKEQ